MEITLYFSEFFKNSWKNRSYTQVILKQCFQVITQDINWVTLPLKLQFTFSKIQNYISQKEEDIIRVGRDFREHLIHLSAAVFMVSSNQVKVRKFMLDFQCTYSKFSTFDILWHECLLGALLSFTDKFILWDDLVGKIIFFALYPLHLFYF